MTIDPGSAELTYIGSESVLTASTGWTMDPNSNMTIPAQMTGWFFMYMDVDLVNNTQSGTIYSIGLLDDFSNYKCF